MRYQIQIKRKKDPVRDLEKYYKNFRKGFRRQISNLNFDGYFQSGREKFYNFLNSTQKRIKKEEKRFLKKAWVKDIKKGRFLSKRTKSVRYWYRDKSPGFYKWADQKFSKVENAFAYSFNQSKYWVVEKAPDLKEGFQDKYVVFSNKGKELFAEYRSSIRNSDWFSKRSVIFSRN